MFVRVCVFLYVSCPCVRERFYDSLCMFMLVTLLSTYSSMHLLCFQLIGVLESSLDSATSTLMILTLLIGTFIFTIIGFVQVSRAGLITSWLECLVGLVVKALRAADLCSVPAFVKDLSSHGQTIPVT